MPFVQVTMIEGRSDEQKHALMAKITNAVEEAVGAKRESIRVAIYEVSPDDWSIGGEPISKLRP
jgi:4-oxalocrotonate tautomerase